MSRAVDDSSRMENQETQERPNPLKDMLLTLQKWIEEVPKGDDLLACPTSTLLHHTQAVGMWLTQLEQFGMMIQGQEEALERLTNIATDVQKVGRDIDNEIDQRIPARLSESVHYTNAGT